ncbi:MAG: endopeptidase La [Spirochaetales bacterium]|uniref:Lon protease n=1 Tax=Candidatus Thalassospirochaeta sargassi TaxID=3119039 RepID=A0AAJ1ICT1_9SPIO|nr:endopeptidase La [Spirochaetales bacterium]
MKLVPSGLKSDKRELPLVALKDLVLLPYMVTPFFTGRESTINAVDAAMAADRMIFVVCQHNENEDPSINDIHDTGTIAHILQVLKLPDGTARILVEGRQRGVVRRIKRERNYSYIQLTPISINTETDDALIPIMAAVLKSFTKYCSLRKSIAKDALKNAEKAEFADKLADVVLANLQVKKELKLEVMSIIDTAERLDAIAVLIEAEIEMLNLQTSISSRVRKKMEKNQKEYFLNEQIKEINKELGKEKDEATEIDDYVKTIEARQAPQEVIEKAKKEGARLSKLQPMSPESGVLRTYLEWLADMPWADKTEDNKDLKRAADILDEDHYNMRKPKDRILDYIAVRQLREKMKGPILCFVGPPGTGKTSLGKSVARALDRRFVRISLGGVRDEAEIRGHRKTYVGALPGKIIQSVKKAGSSNPVFLLDEIDKMSSDFKGDPASALLEVLDPEQNSTFVDHYLEVPYDLSGIMFITTANSIHNIPYPLRDRMEIIEIPGYTDLEKLKIAAEFIIPKQKEENGLLETNIDIQKSALLKIIHNYTMESGVRNLERQIGAILRKTAREALTKGESLNAEYSKTITARSIKKLLGKELFSDDLVYAEDRPGLIHGMAWTELGGTLLPVEAALIEGKGELILTGQLGDVMKESARTALSYIRSNYEKFDLEKDFYEEKSIHIHVPEGAIPKDGPSAGITIVTALLSIFKNKPIKKKFAMTGEVTLTGRILPIGGLKEKTLAAYRNKMTDVLIPEGNRKDYDELPSEVRGTLEFHFVKTAEEAYAILFE